MPKGISVVVTDALVETINTLSTLTTFLHENTTCMIVKQKDVFMYKCTHVITATFLTISSEL